MGVEEEFLLVEGDGRPRPLIQRVMAGFADVEHELKQEQAETASRPHHDVRALVQDLAGRRRALATAVRQSGGALCALGTSPLPVSPTATPDERYDRMMQAYGLTAAEQLTCGCHVHIGVDSRAEGVVALNGIQPWLPVVTALSANSPFAQGVDTGYASYRRMMWDRWPVSGPTQPFADEHDYAAVVAWLIGSGILLDEGMVYFDARLSRRYPTVEIRVADVQPSAGDAALIAVLCRALVETALLEHAAGRGSAPARIDMLRGAAWRAARSGLAGELADPQDGTASPAWASIGRMLERVTPALARTGDLDFVETQLDRIRSQGNGAQQQREVFARRGQLADVVTAAVDGTVVT